PPNRTGSARVRVRTPALSRGCVPGPSAPTLPQPTTGSIPRSHRRSTAMRQRRPGHPGPTTRQRAAQRLYALLLHLYPPAHRRAYGPLMLQTFRDSYRDALATHGRLGPGFWLGVAGDEVKSLVREHATAL